MNSRRNKQARRPKPRKKSPSRIALDGSLAFPEVEGKTVEELKLFLDSDDASVAIFFADKTELHFDLEPRLTVRTDFSDWKTHNARTIKRWPPLTSGSAWTDD